MANAARLAQGSPPYAQLLSVKGAGVLVFAKKGQLVPVVAEHGSRGVRRGSASAGQKLGSGPGGGNGRACPDRA